jgi:hypothetical protein
MKDLTKERISEIVGSSKDAYECLLNLYKEAIYPVEWDNIETIKPWEIHLNKKTAEFILQEMHSEFTGHDGDPWIVNSLILNKGFSAAHEEVPDWKVEVTDDCFTVKVFDRVSADDLEEFLNSHETEKSI